MARRRSTPAIQLLQVSPGPLARAAPAQRREQSIHSVGQLDGHSSVAARIYDYLSNKGRGWAGHRRAITHIHKHSDSDIERVYIHKKSAVAMGSDTHRVVQTIVIVESRITRVSISKLCYLIRCRIRTASSEPSTTRKPADRQKDAAPLNASATRTWLALQSRHRVNSKVSSPASRTWCTVSHALLGAQ